MIRLTANDGIVRHGLEVLSSQDVTASGRGNEDLALRSSLLHGGDLVTGDSSLKCVDRINLSDEHPSTHRVESLSATLSDITVASDDGDLSGNHDIRGTLDTVDERLSASVQVVKLGLGDRVVDVNGRGLQTITLKHAVEVVDAGGGLFRDTVAALKLFGIFVVDESGQVTAVVEDEVELLAVTKGVELLLKAPVVLVFRLALPCEPEGVN